MSHFTFLLVLAGCLLPQLHSQPLTLDVRGVGSITVAATVEPAVQIVRFARAALAQGDNSLSSKEKLEQIYSWFCNQRTCQEALPETIKLSTQYGVIACEPWDEPADLVEKYALALLQKGVALGQSELTPILQKFCEATICLKNTYRVPEKVETLNVEGIGKLTVGALEEPADLVERFAQQVVDAGGSFGFEEMKQLMQYFCARRTCNRLQLNTPVPKITSIDLTIEGIGKMQCAPDRDPADVVEAFAQQAVDAGFSIGFEQMKQMMEYFCTRRPCTRLTINPPSAATPAATPSAKPLELTIEGIGSMTVQVGQDPADVVEAFSQQAVDAGFDIAFEQMKQMMEYFCKQKNCRRLELNPPKSKKPVGDVETSLNF
mgnify:FL=1